MLPLAICLAEAGHEVTAEDERLDDEAKDLLEQMGVALQTELIFDDSLSVIRSSAVSMEHPRIVEALDKGVEVVRRGDCLARMAKTKRLVAVAGSHGKSTTAGMLVDLARLADVEICYLMGARFASGRTPGAWNGSEWLVAEIDESDGTIENFTPEITIVLNADWDHHTLYESRQEYIDTFDRLVQRTQSKAFVDSRLRGDLEDDSDKIGWIDIEPESGGVSMNGWIPIFWRDRKVSVLVDGGFNMANARFAVAAAESLGLETASDWIEFNPICRRQSGKYLSPELRVLEDYAHHPVEIEAVLGVLAESKGSELIVVFQPHRYSRTKALRGELASALKKADRLYLIDVYAAFENPVEGGTIEDLRRECEGAVVVRPDMLGDTLRFDDREKRTVLFLGAGQTDAFAENYAAALTDENRRWGNLFRELGRVSSISSKISRDELMANKTTLRVGGMAELYFEPESLMELRTALSICSEQELPVHMLGRGSNLVVPDTGVDGLVIRLNASYWRRIEKLDGARIRVGAGLRIKELCAAAARLGLEGFEFLEGIPGNVGGALRMNAGAMGGWTFDVVESVVYLEKDGSLVERKKEDLDIGYRKCSELVDTVAIEAVLRPRSIDASETAIRGTIDSYARKRKESQPREPSAGCIFKNPEGDSAGRLIEELGLKGTTVGGASISETHGNFIVNKGGASSADVIELVRLARRVAKRKRDIDLEPEALLYGSRWENVLL